MTDALRGLVLAWDSLPSHTYKLPTNISEWLDYRMRPAIANARAALAQPPAPTAQPAPMSQPNRLIAYSAAAKLREIGYVWDEKSGKWEAAQPVQQPTAQPAARCPLCRYQHGHQIGCENNPVDIALKAAQPVQQPGAEPIGWQYRWTNPGSDPIVHQQDIDWKPVASRAPAQTIQQRIDELRGYKYTDGKPFYEVRAIYTQAAPAQRQPLTVPALTDAQMSECAWGYVADSRNLDAGVTGIIQATQLACAAAWGVTLAQKGERL